VLFAKPLLGVFGHDFVSGATVTVVLAFGAMINSFTGPSAPMLIMTGRPGLVFANNAITVTINIGINLILIPLYGVKGAAVAWLISIALTNSIFAIQIWKSLHMHPFSFSMIKALGAGAVAIAAGLVLRSAAHGYLEVLGAMMAVLVVYAAATMLFGVTAEDRLVARTLTSRLRRSPA
jgi:O-antigen/teichoic acid export membrane protein